MEHLSARDTSGDDAVAACNALGLFGVGDGSRLVLVDEVERWKAADVKAVAAYLEAPTPGTVLALVGELKADAPLAKAVAAKPACGEALLVYDVQKRRLPAWVAEQFEPPGCAGRRSRLPRAGRARRRQRRGARARRSTSSRPGRPASPSSPRTSRGSRPARADTAVFALTDAWGRRDPGAVLQACEALLDRSRAAASRRGAAPARLAHVPRRSRPGESGARGRGRPSPRRSGSAQGASVRRREGLRARAALLGRGAAARP